MMAQSMETLKLCARKCGYVRVSAHKCGFLEKQGRVRVKHQPRKRSGPGKHQIPSANLNGWSGFARFCPVLLGILWPGKGVSAKWRGARIRLASDRFGAFSAGVGHAGWKICWVGDGVALSCAAR